MRVKHKRLKTFIAFVLLAIVIGAGTYSMRWIDDTHKTMTADEAAALMASDPSVLVLDVRRQDEYVKGHIPNSILLPNEEIKAESRVAQTLPDKERTILVYCQTGRRAENAASKLAKMGYKHVYDFGGIVDWKGAKEVGEP